MAVSLRASKHGLLLADRARRQKGWLKSEKEWLDLAEVAPASLKRFWGCEAIQRDKFLRICQALDLHWEEIADTTESVETLPDAIQRMKHLFRKVAELDPVIDERTTRLDEGTLRSLCYGWLHELFTLMLKATESQNPEKSFYFLTREVIRKVSTLFESHDSQSEESPGLFAEILVSDEPGALHQVTEVFKQEEINISQLHIVKEGENKATLNIYCQSNRDKPMSDKAINQLIFALEEKDKVYSVEVESLVQKEVQKRK